LGKLLDAIEINFRILNKAAENSKSSNGNTRVTDKIDKPIVPDFEMGEPENEMAEAKVRKPKCFMVHKRRMDKTG